jgi:hypothetical protein
MFTESEKTIAEKFINLHKKYNGIVSGAIRDNFFYSIQDELNIKNFERRIFIETLVTMNLLRYYAPNAKNGTVLTAEGWDFVTYTEYEKAIKYQKKISKLESINTEKEYIQSKWFYPGLIITIGSLLLSIYSTFSNFWISKESESLQYSIKKMQIRQNTTDSVVNSLKNKKGQLHDGSPKGVSSDK